MSQTDKGVEPLPWADDTDFSLGLKCRKLSFFFFFFFTNFDFHYQIEIKQNG